jgi:hypothetical protein
MIMTVTRLPLWRPAADDERNGLCPLHYGIYQIVFPGKICFLMRFAQVLFRTARAFLLQSSEHFCTSRKNKVFPSHNTSTIPVPLL